MKRLFSKKYKDDKKKKSDKDIEQLQEENKDDEE